MHLSLLQQLELAHASLCDLSIKLQTHSNKRYVYGRWYMGEMYMGDRNPCLYIWVICKHTKLLNELFELAHRTHSRYIITPLILSSLAKWNAGVVLARWYRYLWYQDWITKWAMPATAPRPPNRSGPKDSVFIVWKWNLSSFEYIFFFYSPLKQNINWYKLLMHFCMLIAFLPDLEALSWG